MLAINTATTNRSLGKELYTQIGGRVVTNHLFIYLYGKGMPEIE